MLDQWWLLLILGLGVGTLGTLIGAGGGFILVPILLLVMPNANPAQITAVSLAVVFFNATSGSVAYFRMGRVDLKSAVWFAMAALPGAMFGAYTTNWIPRHQFNVVFGTLLILVTFLLILRPESARDPNVAPHPRHTTREIKDAEGIEHVYHFSMPLGLGLSVLVGFFSSLLGIGGGIIHVPILSRTLNFPVHIATATSHAILSFMALTGTIVHLAQGDLNGQLGNTAILSVGAVIGAQAGARLSSRIKGSGIIRSLAVALGVVGVRILWTALAR